MKLLSKLICILSLVLIYSSCKSKKEPSSPPVEKEEQSVQQKNISAKPDTIKKEVSTSPVEQVKITYHALAINDSVIKSLKKIFPDSQLTIILALNRIDYNKLWRKKTIVIPDTFPADGDLMLYSPFPAHIAVLDSVKKLILFSYGIQAFAVYENGKLIRWGPTSMGKKSTPTPTGFFHTNWKGKQIVSTVNDEWILNWYFNVINKLGVSLHQYELPGYPASHSCLRLREQDAEWFYNWADQWKLSKNGNTILAYGTPIIIFGEYAYEKAAPWNKLIKNGEANNFSADTFINIVHPFLDTILQRQAMRDSVLNLPPAN